MYLMQDIIFLCLCFTKDPPSGQYVSFINFFSYLAPEKNPLKPLRPNARYEQVTACFKLQSSICRSFTEGKAA